MPQSIRRIDLASLRDYSQQEEQAIIGRFFQQTEDLYTPFFVDVGAYDGITGSNTRFLAELGWSGVTVEPTPDAFAQLQALYADNPRITCVQCAVSDYESEAAEMLIAEGPEGVPEAERWHYSQVSTLNEWFSREIVEQHGYRYVPVKVKVRRLTDLLREHAVPGDLGLLCIDCEGEDHRILSAFDLASFRPRLLSVEADDRNRSVYAELLATSGYLEYDHTPCNTFFRRRC
jgi:FkbM family methyltransferase